MWTTFKWMSNFVTDDNCITILYSVHIQLHQTIASLLIDISNLTNQTYWSHNELTMISCYLLPGTWMPGDIWPWLFQCIHFEKAFALHIFSTLPVEFTTSKISRKIVHIICQCKHTTLCQWLNKFLLRVEPGELVLCDNT